MFGAAGLTFAVDLLAHACQPLVLDSSVTTVDVVQRVADYKCATGEQSETDNRARKACWWPTARKALLAPLPRSSLQLLQVILHGIWVRHLVGVHGGRGVVRRPLRVGAPGWREVCKWPVVEWSSGAIAGVAVRPCLLWQGSGGGTPPSLEVWGRNGKGPSSADSFFFPSRPLMRCRKQGWLT